MYLDDTSNCPRADSCDSCRNSKRGGAVLQVHTIGSPVGVFCLTMCVSCVEWDDLPNFALASAVRAVLEHCQHLGIDADEMAALMDKEQRA